MFRRVAILIIASACLACCGMASTYRGPEAPVSATWPTGPAYKNSTSLTGEAAATDLKSSQFCYV